MKPVVEAETAESKTPEKTPEKKEPEKKTSARSTKKETTVKKDTAKKSPAKTTVKKETVKKETVKKERAAKKESKVNAVVEHYGRQIEESAIVANVKKAWTASGKKIKDIKSIELYIKPEENAVYYVVNGTETGAIALYE